MDISLWGHVNHPTYCGRATWYPCWFSMEWVWLPQLSKQVLVSPKHASPRAVSSWGTHFPHLIETCLEGLTENKGPVMLTKALPRQRTAAKTD